MPLNLTSIVVGLLSKQAVPAVSEFGRKAAKKMGIVFAAGAVALAAINTAFGFLLFALWAFVRPMAGPIGSPLIMAGVLGVFAGIMVLIIRNVLQPKTQQNVPGPRAVEQERILLEAEAIIRKQKLPVLLAAVLFGLFAGSQKR